MKLTKAQSFILSNISEDGISEITAGILLKRFCYKKEISSFKESARKGCFVCDALVRKGLFIKRDGKYFLLKPAEIVRKNACRN